MGTTDARLALLSLEGMEEAGIRFALLHGRERLFRGDVSDVDMVVDEHPHVVVQRTAASWRSRGLIPVVVCPYDIGGTAAVWLSTPDASGGVELDLLYDPQGIGRYGLKSSVLLANADFSMAPPVVSNPASLIYQWQKRTAKRQKERLSQLTVLAHSLDEATLLALSEAITGSTHAARRMLEGRPALRARPFGKHTGTRVARLSRRLLMPVGFWAHAAGPAVGAELALRFSRFLVHAETRSTPSPVWQPAWWAIAIMPIRVRPGIFVSTGQPPRWRTPDVTLNASSADGAARQLTAAMTARVESRELHQGRLNDNIARGHGE